MPGMPMLGAVNFAGAGWQSAGMPPMGAACTATIITNSPPPSTFEMNHVSVAGPFLPSVW